MMPGVCVAPCSSSNKHFVSSLEVFACPPKVIVLDRQKLLLLRLRRPHHASTHCVTVVVWCGIVAVTDNTHTMSHGAG